MQSPKLNFSPRGLFIGGRWVAPSEDRSFVSINPSNMEKIADVPSAAKRTSISRSRPPKPPLKIGRAYRSKSGLAALSALLTASRTAPMNSR
jgi:hypothetical protein